MKKLVLMDFAKPSNELFDHEKNIQEAIDHANRNLYGRFGIWVTLRDTLLFGYLLEVEYPDEEEIKNIGMRLKGIGQYLLNHYPEYENKKVGTRLFRYTDVTERFMRRQQND